MSSPGQKPFRGMQIDKTHKLSRGLVGCWIFNEKIGDKVFDLSGHGNYGTIVGADWVPGGLDFNGTSDYVSFTKPVMDFRADTTNFTVLLLMKTVYSAADNYIIGTNQDNGWYLRTQNNSEHKLLIKIDDGSDDEYAIGTVSLNDGVQHQIGITLNSNTNEFLGYVDGIKDITLPTGSVNDLADTFRIGSVLPLKYYTGTISTVIIYNRALSAVEIAQLHREPYAMFQQPISPASLYYEAGAPPTLSIPIAMYHYQHH